MVMEMGVKYKFTAEDLTLIQQVKAKNKNKRIDKRLTVLEMSAQGIDRADISIGFGGVRDIALSLLMNIDYTFLQ